MTISTKVILDSISPAGKRLTTFELEYPRYIHAEVMTHRVFSRNAQSFRAIPVERMVNSVRESTWYPIFMKNKPGMSAIEELTFDEQRLACESWDYAKLKCIEEAVFLADLGVHKQVVNRILEPFSTIKVILSATEFDNFFNLRIHPEAQQEIQKLALAMKEVMDKSVPLLIKEEQWHLPYINDKDWTDLSFNINTLKKISVARCARVSYLNHDKILDYSKDIDLYNQLVENKHMSPLEHIATPSIALDPYTNLIPTSNFIGWDQHRYFVETKGNL